MKISIYVVAHKFWADLERTARYDIIVLAALRARLVHGGPMRKKKALKPRPNHVENAMAETLDQLAEFESLRRDLLPKLLQAVRDGKSAEEIIETGKAVAAARLVSMSTSSDDRAAYAAVKEILDRTMGKATEKKEITHRLDRLSDEQIDAMVMSAIEDISDETDED